MVVPTLFEKQYKKQNFLTYYAYMKSFFDKSKFLFFKRYAKTINIITIAIKSNNMMNNLFKIVP